VLAGNLLLTGRPGVGKTTVIMRLADALGDLTKAGFYTEEMRRGGQRQGFCIVTFSEREATLAHVGIKSRFRVGRYGVDVAAFEETVLPELSRPCGLIIIDEIGKMECFSSRFVDTVRQLLDGETPVVATVASKGAGFIAEAKARPDVQVIDVTHDNRDTLPQDLARELKAGD
jgi:nucleoside-triphosphatase